MKIKYFAWIKDITNVEEEDVDYNKFNTLNKVKDYLINKYPNLKKHNDKYLDYERTKRKSERFVYK